MFAIQEGRLGNYHDDILNLAILSLRYLFSTRSNVVSISPDQLVKFSSVQFSSVQDGIYELRKIHRYAIHPVFQYVPLCH